MKAIIIEDEKFVAKELATKISEVDSSIEIIEVLSSVKQATQWFKTNPEPELVFADIQLSDGVSFDLFEKFNLACPIIFTTAYNEYAIRAFKVNSMDYLLKPVDRIELKAAIEKSKKTMLNNSKNSIDFQKIIDAINGSDHKKTLYKEHFMANLRNSSVIIKVSDIAYFVRDNLNYLVTFEGQKYILDYTTLEEIEELIDPDIFYRINRQVIVNIQAINTLHNSMNYKMTIKLKSPNHTLSIDISREKAPLFKKWLDR